MKHTKEGEGPITAYEKLLVANIAAEKAYLKALATAESEKADAETTDAARADWLRKAAKAMNLAATNA